MRDLAERDYLLLRAQREREIGTTSEDNCVAMTHLRMAEEYERRARSIEEGPRLTAVR